jgi:hypothetical protein
VSTGIARPLLPSSSPAHRLPDSCSTTPSYNSNASEHTRETIRGDRTPPWHSPCSSAGFRRAVSDVQLDLETQRVLGLAFELTFLAPRTGDCADDVKQAIAAKIIELAKSGERNPDILAQQALNKIRGPQQ